MHYKFLPEFRVTKIADYTKTVQFDVKRNALYMEVVFGMPMEITK